jgi:dTDP-4-dehydrorhamnose reductase
MTLMTFNNHLQPATSSLQLWGGLECTVNRVRDQYFSQMDRNGHAERLQDLERFASLGIRAIRYPVLWERTAPDGIDSADWSWSDERLPVLQQLGVAPIVGLLHHGSGPRHTNLMAPDFAEKLAEYAGAVANRYPWVEYWTPVNEICTTARFSGLNGVWYPHDNSEASFIRALINQARATVLSMQAIRAVNPNAKLVQTDDLSRTYGTPEMAEFTNFFNERRWIGWDMLVGKIDENHALWDYLLSNGASAEELLWFKANACPPDIMGVNYYATSERWLDHRVERYPENRRTSYRGVPHADIECPRVLATPTPGVGPLLQETWDRYGLPIAITEAHIDAKREDQLRWLVEMWNAAKKVQQGGADIRAVTVWALLGSYDWNCLVTECRGYYESGPFDVRSPQPRATAVATLMRELSSGRPLSHPVLQGQGWWRRPGRFFAKPVATRTAVADINDRGAFRSTFPQPILIIGATGTLGRAFARICEQRNLAHHVLTRQEMDITDPASVEAAIVRYKPWAIVNAGGYVRVDDAEDDVERCMLENASGPTVLALAAIRHALRFMTFSSDLVFDGNTDRPYVESDKVAPLGVYGRSKADAERRVLDSDPQALIIRTSAFFGPWDQHNFVTQALDALGNGRPFAAAADQVVTPTYVPDLVHTCLDLLIDRECGVWHLTSGTAMTWAELAQQACAAAGVDASGLELRTGAELGNRAARPRNSAMSSERGMLLPSFQDALGRYLHEREVVAQVEEQQEQEAPAHYAR